MFAVEGANIFRRVLLKNWLRRYAFAGGGPHVGDIQIFVTVPVVIHPTDAPSCATVFPPRVRPDCPESSGAIVAVKVFAAKVVDHAKVRPAVVVIGTPAA